MNYSTPSKIISSFKTLSKEESLKRYKKIKKIAFYDKLTFPTILILSMIIGLGKSPAFFLFCMLSGLFLACIGDLLLTRLIFGKIITTDDIEKLPAVLIHKNKQKENSQTTVNLPIFQEKIKEIYKTDPNFFQEEKLYSFKKENTENKEDTENQYENYELFLENLNLERDSEIIFSSITLKSKKSKNNENYIFKSTFEIFEDKKINEKYLNSIEFVNKDILENTNLEKLDLGIVLLLENAYTQYEKNKSEKIFQKALSLEKEKEDLNNFIKKIENKPENSLQKCIDFSLIQDEIRVFKTLNTTDLSQKI